MSTDVNRLGLLRLMSLMSPTLPIGGFTYSQGIERAVEDQWIVDVDSAYEWLSKQLHYGLTYTDLPIMLRLYNAFKGNNKAEVIRWGQVLLACRETRELRQEEVNRGRALIKVLEALDSSVTTGWEDTISTNHLSGFALISTHWQIPVVDLLLGYSWSWLENQVSAVVKIIPLGQTQGQQLLHKLMQLIPDIVDQSMTLTEENIGMSQPALAIASSLHETQYTRIFRS
ncbi:MAG: urease accessory protein UreF [Gammaproteobacteria bacterium]|nr:urease accessory protein UreF [Gammaproteobacteria bacterium]